MKPPKHLVLDEDVHRALKRMKRETGLTVKDLGNCALRSSLDRPSLAEVMGERLVASGLLSEDEFESIRTEAIAELCQSAEDVSTIVRKTKRQTFASGSWEIKELSRDPEGAFQVALGWVKDHRLRPMTLHKHVGLEVLILLQGSVFVSVDLESRILRPPDTITISPGAVHSVTPLERNTRLLGVISPPEPAIASEETSQ